MQTDAQGATVQAGGAGIDLAVSTELDQAVARLSERVTAGPDRLAPVISVTSRSSAARRSSSGHRLDVQQYRGHPSPLVNDGGGRGPRTLPETRPWRNPHRTILPRAPKTTYFSGGLSKQAEWVEES